MDDLSFIHDVAPGIPWICKADTCLQQADGRGPEGYPGFLKGGGASGL
jgi:hypothetical protein